MITTQHLIDRPAHRFVERMVREGKWRQEVVPAETVGLARDLTIYRAHRSGKLIAYDEHGDQADPLPIEVV